MNISTDKKGNELYIDNFGVKLKLSSQPYPRNLGTFHADQTIFFTKRIRSKHLFRKDNSYGFNYMLIQSSPKLQTIILVDEVGRYEIPVEIVKQGRLRNFSKTTGDGNQYELQYFVPLSVIENYEVK